MVIRNSTKRLQMTNKDKDDLMKEFLDINAKIANVGSATDQTVLWFMEFPQFFERIYNKGRDEGFKEGYKEGQKNMEIKLGKLN